MSKFPKLKYLNSYSAFHGVITNSTQNVNKSDKEWIDNHYNKNNSLDISNTLLSPELALKLGKCLRLGNAEDLVVYSDKLKADLTDILLNRAIERKISSSSVVVNDQ